MKILFLASAYHRAEAFASICTALESLGHEVTYYPIYMRVFEAGQAMSKGMKVDEATSNRMGLPKVWEDVLTLASQHDLAILWKAEALTPDVIKTMSELTRTVYYSWDDPYQLEVDHPAILRASMCHVAASCCERSSKVYRAGKTLWLPPGYDPVTHYETQKPEVDVCFIATNTYCKQMYGKPPSGDPPFDRRELVANVLKVTDSVELWGRGADSLGWTHPEHGDPLFAKYYKGFIKFEEARGAFSRAKVTINSHVRRNGYKYFNERTFQIMGCSRPQLIDRNPGTEEVLPDSVCMTYDSVGEVRDALRYLLTGHWEEMGIKAKEFSKDFTWTRFCEKLLAASV